MLTVSTRFFWVGFVGEQLPSMTERVNPNYAKILAHQRSQQ
jgi:hypothetical protein